MTDQNNKNAECEGEGVQPLRCMGMPVLLDAGCATGGAIGWTPWSWRLLQLVCGGPPIAMWLTSLTATTR